MPKPNPYRKPARSKALSKIELQAAYHRFGSVRKAAQKLGIPKSTFHDIIKGKTKEPTLEVKQKMSKSFSKLSDKEKSDIKKAARFLPKITPEKTVSRADFLKALKYRKEGVIDADLIERIKRGYERGKGKK